MNKLPYVSTLTHCAVLSLALSAGFGAGGNRLCRSTSAVSAQLKTGATVRYRTGGKKGRHLELTHHGRDNHGYARRLLVLNDEALRALNGERLQGEIRIGMQEDFGESLMPGILGEFKRHHPGMRMIARVDRNRRCSRRSITTRLIWRCSGSRRVQQRDGRLIAQCPLGG